MATTLAPPAEAAGSFAVAQDPAAAANDTGPGSPLATPGVFEATDKIVRIPAQELCARVVEKNLEFAKAHVVEATGHNDGEQIDRVEKVWGMKGEPYCAMGQYWIFAKTLAELNGVDLPPSKAAETLAGLRGDIKDFYLEFSPACADMIAAAKKRGQWRGFTADNFRPGEIGPGDYVFFNFGSKSRPQRHVGQYVRYSGSHIVTVEWNTAAGPDDKSSDPRGFGGCFVKLRDPDASYVEGWLSWSHQ